MQRVGAELREVTGWRVSRGWGGSVQRVAAGLGEATGVEGFGPALPGQGTDPLTNKGLVFMEPGTVPCSGADAADATVKRGWVPSQVFMEGAAWGLWPSRCACGVAPEASLRTGCMGEVWRARRVMWPWA